jgi:hypothetical protein
MAKYSDEFTLQIRSDDKTMTWRELGEKYKLSHNQVHYLLHKKKLTINRIPKKPPPKQSSNYVSKFWEDFNALFRKIGL